MIQTAYTMQHPVVTAYVKSKPSSYVCSIYVLAEEGMQLINVEEHMSPVIA